MNLNENKEGEIELSYLWLGENCIPNIKNQEVNFSTDLEFEFIEKKFHIKYKDNYLNNFYGQNIINISAIVGKNGSGKTSIINFLKDCKFENYELKQIVIFKKSNEIHMFNTINLKEDNICNNTKYKINIHDLSSHNFKDKFNELGVRSIIFYSDNFNCRRGNLRRNNTKKIYDISTDHLIVSDKYNELSNKMNIDQVENFNVSDIFRELNFILDKSKILDKNEIITPAIKYIKICINDEKDWLESILNNLNDENPFEPAIKKIGELLNILMNKQNNINEKNNHYFKLIIIFNVLLKLSDYPQEYDENFETESKISSINLDNYFEITKNFLEHFKNTKIFKENLGLYDFIDKLDIFKDKWVQSNNFSTLILEVNDDNVVLLKDFLKKYLESNTLSLFKIKWVQEIGEKYRELSSGEEAMLKIYSRFYSMINDRDMNVNSHELNNRLKDDEKNLLILLDEPELYLHPEWQRKLVSRLVEFFEDIFKDRNTQIILTSNTPFVISDIPKDNIIFMKKNEESELCEVIPKENICVETFGANIHTLLTNSFFMKNTIGEFANQKIKDSLKIMDKYKKFKDSNIDESEFKKEYIKYMCCKENEEVSIEKMKKKIKYIIEIIGEPLIKRKLEEIYRTNFPEDRKDYELEIKKLQQEKVKLQQIIKNEGLDTINGVMGLLYEKIKELEKRAGDRI